MPTPISPRKEKTPQFMQLATATFVVDGRKLDRKKMMRTKWADII